MATVTSRREALAEFARGRRGADGTGLTARRAGIALAVLVLLGGAIAWMLGAFGGPREVRQLRTLVDQEIRQLDQAVKSGVAFDSVPTNFGAIMEQARAVPEAQRGDAWREMGRLFEARETAEVQTFFRLPPADRDAELDRRIRAEEDRRKARDAARAPSDRGGQRGGGGGGGGGSPRGAPTGGGTATAGGPPGGRGGSTEDQRNQRYKASIDRTTPEQRAMRMEYRRVMQERRAKLGLSERRW